MRRIATSLFLLSVSALSSSNIMPLIALHQNSDSELGQIFDISSNKRDNKASNPCSSEANEFPELCKILNRGGEPDGTIIDITAGPNIKEYRWHKYPRQLDHIPNYSDADIINRFLSTFGDHDDDRSQPLEVPDAINERNNKENRDRPYALQLKPATRRPTIILEPEKADEAYLTRDDNDDNDLNSAIYMLEIKKKAATKPGSEYFDENETPLIPGKDLKTVVKKRYVSLWSRLQAISPPNRANELPHRRHMHLYYHHLPDEIDGKPIPEDPRMLFKRPPGSPLRWG